jgi:hypothetical protein
MKHSVPIRGLVGAPRSPIFQGRFGRMFRGARPATFGVDNGDAVPALEALAKAMLGDDGPSDGADPEESGIPSLYTYLGQFIDHDLTFDPASSLQKQNDPNALADFRDPAFDLDCVYGRGPDDQPYMYEGDAGRQTFLLGDPITGGHPTARDLPRGPNGRALIGDPRNDENTIVSQLQGLFHRFHNRVIADNPDITFQEAQQLVRFHYQYIVLNDFLPRIISKEVLDKLRVNGQFDRHKIEFYHWRNDPFMPVEFSGACYRFGHTMVRPGYRIQDQKDPLNPKDKLFSIFPDLVGFQRVKVDNALDWGRFIDIPPLKNNNTENDRLQFAYRLDTSVVGPLGDLPHPGVVSGKPFSLVERNLVRGLRLGLPSGQSVAEIMGIIPIPDEEIWVGKAEDDNLNNPGNLNNILQLNADGKFAPAGDEGDLADVFRGNCPLWTYILAEAMHHVDTNVVVAVSIPGTKINTPQLGPVGGRIVAEVFLGLMFADDDSLLSLNRNWKPVDSGGNELPNYKLKDFVDYALGN